MNGSNIVATLPPCSAADVTRYGEIVISKENHVQWFRFDAANGLIKVAEQKFPRPIWNVKFADSGLVFFCSYCISEFIFQKTQIVDIVL